MAGQIVVSRNYYRIAALDTSFRRASADLGWFLTPQRHNEDIRSHAFRMVKRPRDGQAFAGFLLKQFKL